MIRKIGLYIFAAALFYAGITHFIYDHGFARMLPQWVPLKLEIVYMSGITEWLLSLLLIFPQTRKAAGLATAVFLIAVLPANIYAAIYSIPGSLVGGSQSSGSLDPPALPASTHLVGSRLFTGFETSASV